MQMGAENYPKAYIDPAEVLNATKLEFETSRDEAAVYRQFLAAHPGMNPEQVEARHYDIMMECTAALAGLYPNLNSNFYPNAYQGVDLHSRVIPFSAAVAESVTALVESLKEDLPTRQATKNLSWSEEEHKLFLLGMDIHGRGDWKSISQNFVLSRTPSQIASHAQKFFKRLKKCQRNVQEFTTMNDVFQHLGYTSTNTAVDYYAENPAPISPLPMRIDPNSPSFYFQ